MSNNQTLLRIAIDRGRNELGYDQVQLFPRIVKRRAEEDTPLIRLEEADQT